MALTSGARKGTDFFYEDMHLAHTGVAPFLLLRGNGKVVIHDPGSGTTLGLSSGGVVGLVPCIESSCLDLYFEGSFHQGYRILSS